MNVLKLKEEYEKEITKINAFYKVNEPKYLKTVNNLIIAIGVIACFVIAGAKLFFNSQQKIIIGIGLIILIEIIFWLIRHVYLKKKLVNRINNNVFISDYRMARIYALRRILIKANICWECTDKIQIIIDEVSRNKNELIPLECTVKYIMKPLLFIFIPCFTVFLDHLTQPACIGEQTWIFVQILRLVVMMGTIVIMVLEPAKLLLYRKYEDFISDLRLLQVINISIFNNVENENGIYF